MTINILNEKGNGLLDRNVSIMLNLAKKELDKGNDRNFYDILVAMVEEIKPYIQREYPSESDSPNLWHTGTPTEREWVLGIFREADTGWINPVPFVCEYLQGLKTKATTEEGWIIKNCTDIDQPCDYYKKLQCIAWQKIEPYKEEQPAK